MPVKGIPDPHVHRLCRRCGKWFEPGEGSLMPPVISGPLGAMRALRARLDESLMQFQCHRCTRIRRTREKVLWGMLLGFIALMLLLERLGLIK